MTTKEFQTDADSVPVLDAAFWSEGKEITGLVLNARRVKMETGEGLMYGLSVSPAVEIGGESCEEVEIGNLTGFRMWIDKLKRESGFDGLKKGDTVILRCIRVVKAKKEGFSDSPRFGGKVVRA